jgi:hypothetical protein
MSATDQATIVCFQILPIALAVRSELLLRPESGGDDPAACS